MEHAYNIIRVKVPGSTMLMGEHAVLKGYSALVTAIEKYITIELTTREDNKVIINSSLGYYQSFIDEIKPSKKLAFVISAINCYQPMLQNGFRLDIHSEFVHTIGLGSSAAVTAGTIAALGSMLSMPVTPSHIFEQSLLVIKGIQCRGSGADLAASIHGGIISYRPDPFEIVKLKGSPSLSLFYSGYKTKTPEVLKKMDSLIPTNKYLYKKLFNYMGELTSASVNALISENWSKLGGLMNMYQGAMDSLGVNDKTLSIIIYELREDINTLGTKISGSGLGDCIVALKKNSDRALSLRGFSEIPINISKSGLRIEKVAH